MTEPKDTATVMAKTIEATGDEKAQAAGAAKESPDAVEASDAAYVEPTLREIFQIPDQALDKGDEHWQAFKDKLKEEAKGIKWTAAMPDLAAKICELLDIKIHFILMTAWKKADALRQALADSKADPERSIYLDLVEHSIDYETNPFVEVKIKAVSVKKITLTVALNFKLKGFSLKVQDGAIIEINTGSCEAKGSIKYDKLTIAEKKLTPIKFPLTIKIPNLSSFGTPAEEEGKPSNPDGASLKPDDQKPDAVERIEL